jgi:hypothetical protein
MKIEAQSEHTLDFPRVSSSVEVHVNTSNIVLKIYIYIYIYIYINTLYLSITFFRSKPLL